MLPFNREAEKKHVFLLMAGPLGLGPNPLLERWKKKFCFYMYLLTNLLYSCNGHYSNKIYYMYTIC